MKGDRPEATVVGSGIAGVMTASTARCSATSWPGSGFASGAPRSGSASVRARASRSPNRPPAAERPAPPRPTLPGQSAPHRAARRPAEPTPSRSPDPSRQGARPDTIGAGGFAAAGPLVHTGSESAMSPPSTTSHLGPLGSTIHVLRADAATIAELAAVDWSRYFGRVSLDPARGLITLMSPSRLHDDLSEILSDIVDMAADAFGRTSKGLRMTRLRPRGDPPGTGLEPDCSFYVGERAERYRLALMEGNTAADAFLEETGPDLVVEVEVTHVDKGKIERYGALGAREFWQIRGRRNDREVAVEFFALRSDGPPRPLAASVVLQGLTPGDVCEAIEPVRFSRNVTERMQAVARIVRRRREGSVRVREEDPPPYATTGQPGAAAPARPHR